LSRLSAFLAGALGEDERGGAAVDEGEEGEEEEEEGEERQISFSGVRVKL